MTVAYNPNEPMGGSVTDGMVGRITDPITGIGRFVPNLDPNVVGIDAQTGATAPLGTDMSFSASIRRQIMAGVINGDFSELPANGADTAIVSDTADINYNPLPGWTWNPDTTGLYTAVITADATYPSGYKLAITSPAGTAVTCGISQFVAVPMSKGQQYRVLLSVYLNGTEGLLRYQYYMADAVTAIGSAITTVATGAGETKVDAGLVPSTAAYIKVEPRIDSSTSTAIGEVRAAFVPAEVTLGLKSRATATAAITTTETQVTGITVPAGSFTVGSTYRITAYGVVTSSVINAVTIRVRVGPTTLTGNIAGNRAPNSTNSASADGFKAEFLFTVRTVGASGTCIASGETIGGTNQPFNSIAWVNGVTATVVVDTTVKNILELTCVTAAGTTSVTFTQALIECVMAS